MIIEDRLTKFGRVRNSKFTFGFDSEASREDLNAHLGVYEDLDEEGRLLCLRCRIGDPVWFVVQDVDDPSRWEICEPQKITEVGTRGFWISGLLDEPDGMHMFTPWSALGSEAFLSREAAEEKLKECDGDG